MITFRMMMRKARGAGTILDSIYILHWWRTWINLSILRTKKIELKATRA